MNDTGYARIAFQCEAVGDTPSSDEDQRAVLEIGIGEPKKDFLGDVAFGSMIRLRIGGQAFADTMMLYGYSLRTFSEELERMQSELAGSARLYDWDSELLLCFTVVDRRRGRIAVGGRFTPAVFNTTATSAERFISNVRDGRPGIVIAFEGLSFDQSFLNRPVSDLKRFVDAHATECAGPTCPI